MAGDFDARPNSVSLPRQVPEVTSEELDEEPDALPLEQEADPTDQQVKPVNIDLLEDVIASPPAL